MNRGSEWHKWDLHVHTPESGMANQFNCTWDDYVQQLFKKAIQEEIYAIGITDYFSIDGYKKIRKEYLENEEKLLQLFTSEEITKIKNIAIFPNVEFRLDTMVNRSRVNYHVIFSDKVKIDDIEDNFLRNIDILAEQNPSGSPVRMKLHRSNIERLGNLLRQQQPDFPAGSDYTTGCTIAMVSHLQIEELLHDRSDLFGDKYIIVIPVDEDLSRISWKGQDVLMRKELYQVANVFFTSNPSTIKFGLGEYHDSKEQFLSEFKSSKPCVVGSDAHCIDGLFSFPENNSRICWIKAQPTFEGLKQILYEPEERVRIQTTKPDDKNIYQVIDSVTLSEEGFWNDTIYFNQNLNTIIGGRSTGKSSLLKAIAAKHGCEEVESDDFVRGHLSGVSINWQDGTNQVGREIDYFKQSYMHDIASDTKKTNALVETIIRSKDTSGVYSKYDERLRDTERVITGDLFNLFQMQKEYLKKKDELKALGKQEGVQQQIEILKSKIVDLQKGSAITLEEQTNFEAQQVKLKECMHMLEQAEADVKVFKSVQTLTPFIYNFEEQHALNTLSYGLNGSEFAREYKNLQIATERQFSNLVLKYIDSTQAAMGKLVAQKLTILDSESYKKGLANIEGNKELKDINLRLLAEEKKLTEIRQCQSQIDALNKKLSELIDKVVENHCLFRLYADDVVKESSISYDGLAIRVQRHHHKSQLKVFLENRLNQRGYERQGYLSRFVDNYDSDNKGNISDILNQLLNGSLQLKNGYDAYNVASELLAKSWYSLSYELSYQGDLFDQMSEGKQAFVILKLLLDFSDKKCPILIDQPEDSLDNRAIYNELVTYIRKKKVERQIILVTHNPNVVVSADSENVIVANQEGTSCHNNGRFKFQYINGALEETYPKDKDEPIILASQGIREHVCDILEGGRVAFEKREQKYGFKS